MRTAARSVTNAERDEALRVCAQDLPGRVFVAARILESGTRRLLAVEDESGLALCWSGANVVPVATTDGSRRALARALRHGRSRCASILGPREETLGLWEHLKGHWGPRHRAVRSPQPLLVTRTPPSALGITVDERVRRARGDEVDLVLPAAEHMFTAEIGYPPYVGTARGYVQSLQLLIAKGHTWIAVDDGAVIFKADIGSQALGCAQVQGVWLAPHLRGRGLAVSLLGSVLEQIMAEDVDLVTLYVNDYNVPARATYEHLGMTDHGSFATVLL